jgi:hypothetical protein
MLVPDILTTAQATCLIDIKARVFLRLLDAAILGA